MLNQVSPRFILLLSLFVSVHTSMLGQFQWIDIEQDPNSYKLETEGLLVDDFGNSYVLGHYLLRAELCGNTFWNGNGGTKSMYLMKYNASGNCLWAVDANGDSFDGVVPEQMIFDQSGSIVIAGYFEGPDLDMGSLSLNGNSSGVTGFIIKVDTNGTAVWGTELEGDRVYCQSLVVDDQNNIWAAGSFYETATIGSTNYTVPGGSSVLSNLFIAKLDSNGSIKSADQYTQTSYWLDFMKMNSEGDLILAGHSGVDGFLIKYDTSGSGMVIWDEDLDSQDTKVDGLALDEDDQIYVVGSYEGSIFFNPGGIGSISSGDDNYLVQYDKDGNTLNRKGFRKTNIQSLNFINNQLYLVGEVYDSLGYGRLSSHPIERRDVFVLVMDTNLYDYKKLWYADFGISSGTFFKNTRLQIGPNSEFYICGTYEDSLYSGSSNGYTVNNSIYTAKIGDSTSFSNLPILDILNYEGDYCLNDSAFVLEVFPTGGTLSGLGVVNDSILDPAAVEFTIYDNGITYYYDVDGRTRMTRYEEANFLAPPHPSIDTNVVGVFSVWIGYPSFQWYQDGNLLAGEDEFSIDYLTYGTGEFYVEVESSQGCIGNSDTVTISPPDTNNTGISFSNYEKDAFKIYPNPSTNGQFTIKQTTENNMPHLAVQIEIINALGQTVLNRKIGSKELTNGYVVSRLKEGFYQIRIQTEGGTFVRSQKLIVH